MKPGLHYNVPWDAYDKLDGVRAIYLQHLKRSPGHLKAYLDQPRKPDTKALIMGRAIHAAVLEPDRFAGAFVAAPEVDRRTKGGRETWDLFVNSLSPETVIMPADDLANINGMAIAIQNNKAAQPILNLKCSEISLLWIDPATMLPCKGRPDSYTEEHGGLLVDLKSCRNAEPYNFQRDIWQFGYARQLAWYRRGLNMLDKPVKHCLIIAVEKEPPYGVMVYDVLENILNEIENENLALLKKYKYCKENNVWPAYPEVVISIATPKWAEIGMEEEDEQGN